MLLVEDWRKPIERVELVYDDQEVSIELRLEAAKLRIDWYAAQGSYDRCRRVAGEAARLGATVLERDHPLVLMLRNSEAYWLSILASMTWQLAVFLPWSPT